MKKKITYVALLALTSPALADMSEVEAALKSNSTDTFREAAAKGIPEIEARIEMLNEYLIDIRTRTKNLRAGIEKKYPDHKKKYPALKAHVDGVEEITRYHKGEIFRLEQSRPRQEFLTDAISMLDINRKIARHQMELAQKLAAYDAKINEDKELLALKRLHYDLPQQEELAYVELRVAALRKAITEFERDQGRSPSLQEFTIGPIVGITDPEEVKELGPDRIWIEKRVSAIMEDLSKKPIAVVPEKTKPKAGKH